MLRVRGGYLLRGLFVEFYVVLICGVLIYYRFPLKYLYKEFVS